MSGPYRVAPPVVPAEPEPPQDSLSFGLFLIFLKVLTYLVIFGGF